MRHAILIEPCLSGTRPFQRRALILALGVGIISALVLSAAAPDTAPERQGFPEAGQSPSFIPETVRLRTPE